MLNPGPPQRPLSFTPANLKGEIVVCRGSEGILSYGCSGNDVGDAHLLHACAVTGWCQ